MLDCRLELDMDDVVAIAIDSQATGTVLDLTGLERVTIESPGLISWVEESLAADADAHTVEDLSSFGRDLFTMAPLPISFSSRPFLAFSGSMFTNTPAGTAGIVEDSSDQLHITAGSLLGSSSSSSDS